MITAPSDQEIPGAVARCVTMGLGSRLKLAVRLISISAPRIGYCSCAGTCGKRTFNELY